MKVRVNIETIQGEIIEKTIIVEKGEEGELEAALRGKLPHDKKYQTEEGETIMSSQIISKAKNSLKEDPMKKQKNSKSKEVKKDRKVMEPKQKGKKQAKKKEAPVAVEPVEQTKAEVKETRKSLMLKAKEKGIRNFRVLNKEEYKIVLADDATQEVIDRVVAGAVTRWKSGWKFQRKKTETQAS